MTDKNGHDLREGDRVQIVDDNYSGNSGTVVGFVDQRYVLVKIYGESYPLDLEGRQVVKMSREVVEMAGWQDIRNEIDNVLRANGIRPNSPSALGSNYLAVSVDTESEARSAERILRQVGNVKNVTVESWINEGDKEWMVRAEFSAVSMMARRDELQRGDRVVVDGKQGTIGRLGGSGTQDAAAVEFPDGSVDWVPYEKIQKMSNDAPARAFDAVDLAREARCTYCTRVVTMSARTLGEHRAVEGLCPGSSRRVAEFDYLNRPIFEAKTFDASGRWSYCEASDGNQHIKASEDHAALCGQPTSRVLGPADPDQLASGVCTLCAATMRSRRRSGR